MALAHQSIATINSPEFINLQPLDINPLMSKCEIKVLYLGENRNKSYISKEVAAEMAKSLRGAPIVGYYKENKEDFADHGEQLILDDEGIHFNCLTKPYGFVSPDAKVWFKEFEDIDDFGNSIIRTYLMTTGYLWTGQFEQAQQVLDQNGKPHSMELDEKSLQGHWSQNIKQNMEFFIINDAIFSKLCILGDDVQPCFEGSGITAPQASTLFTLDADFKQSLFNMMQDLKNVLEGGKMVADIKENVSPEFTAIDETSEEDSNVNFEKKEEDITLFEKKEEEKEEEKEQKEDSSEDKNEDEKKSEDEDNAKKKYAALEADYNELQSKYAALEECVKDLKEFKQKVENAEKDDLIAQFYMLSEEDKKDVIENKTKYSLDEIKSKLAVICFEKKVNFNLDTQNENKNSKRDVEKVVTTFNIETKQDSTPDWIKAVEDTMNNRF